MAPTLLSLVGMEVPDTVQGRDLLPLFDGEPGPFQPNNWANQETLRPLQAALDARLAAELARQGDAFASPEQRRQLWGYAVDDVEAMPYTA